MTDGAAPVLWEVFVRSRRGLSHTHVGSLRAPDAHLALRNARDVYTRRQDGVSIWVVPTPEISTRNCASAGRAATPRPSATMKRRRAGSCNTRFKAGSGRRRSWRGL